jgi:hypothetical protein
MLLLLAGLDLLLLQRGYALPLVLEAELLPAALLAIGLRLWSLHKLERPRVARLPLRALHSPLVGLGGRAGILAHQVHSGALWQESYGLGWPSVVCEALEAVLASLRGESMQDHESELPRIPFHALG